VGTFISDGTIVDDVIARSLLPRLGSTDDVAIDPAEVHKAETKSQRCMNWITEVLLGDEWDKFCRVRVCAANECSAERANCTAPGMLLRGILEAKCAWAQSRALLLVQPTRSHAPGSTNSTDSMFNLAPTLDSRCLSTAIATEPHLTTGGMAAEVFITP
jgi:hypothetical protein